MRRQPVEVFEKLSLSDEEVDLSFSYYFNWGYPDYVREAFNLILELSDNDERQVLNNEISWSHLRQLLELAESEHIKYLIAGNPATPPCVLDYLSKQASVRVVERVAEHPGVHPSTLNRLAEHPEGCVRLAVAENSNVSAGTFSRLASDRNIDVRYCLAENVHTPQTVLLKLSGDDNPYVAARAEQTLNRLSGADVIEGHFGETSKRRAARKISS